MNKAIALNSNKPGMFLFTVLLISITLFGISTVTTIKLLTKSKIVIVPELNFKSVESARSMCRVKRLKIDISEYRFDQRIPANVILDQEPKAEEKVKSGRIIKVVVSRGSQSVKIPVLTNQSLRAATISIENAGFHIGRVTRIYDNSIPKDQILDQWPAPKTDLTRGKNINLLISNGPKPVWYIMPKLKGSHIDDASRTLELLGMDLREIKRKVDNTLPSGTIISQTPQAGARIKTGIPAGLLVTTRTDNNNLVSRFVTINYHVPASQRDVRIKMLVRDESGLHELYNAMEKPDTDLVIRRTLSGESAKLKIYINSKLAEQRDI